VADDDVMAGDSADPAGDERPSRGLSAKVQVVILVANVAFWLAILGWTLGGDRHDPPDLLDDPAFAAAAEPVCAATVSAIEALGLPTEVGSAAERAELVDAQVLLLTDMVGSLEVLPRPDGEQGGWVATWLTDWRTHIADRQAWADDLRVGDDHAFTESPRGNEPVSAVIDNFAAVNGMESCATPGDV
jgi:hypothetical protein